MGRTEYSSMSLAVARVVHAAPGVLTMADVRRGVSHGGLAVFASNGDLLDATARLVGLGVLRPGRTENGSVGVEWRGAR
jgi:hypothetical protein